MTRLNLPSYSFKIKSVGDKQQIFDSIRRRYVALTPEEWVRQNMVAHLIETRHVPQMRISNETTIKYNGLTKRCDTVIYDANLKPLMIAEYKATTIELTQLVFDQIAIYNLKLEVPYLLVSNGLQHIFCKVDTVNKCYQFYPDVFDYSQLSEL